MISTIWNVFSIFLYFTRILIYIFHRSTERKCSAPILAGPVARSAVSSGVALHHGMFDPQNTLFGLLPSERQAALHYNLLLVQGIPPCKDLPKEFHKALVLGEVIMPLIDVPVSWAGARGDVGNLLPLQPTNLIVVQWYCPRWLAR